MKPAVVYRMFDASGALLYVGLSTTPGARFMQHAGEKPWWSDVASIALEHCESLDDAARREREVVEAEAPLHNVLLVARAARRPKQPSGLPAPRSVRFSAEVDAALVARAEELDRSVSWVVQEAVAAFLEEPAWK